MKRFALLCAMIFAVALPASAKDPGWRQIPADSYASFVKNWNDVGQPVFCALVRSPAEWDAVFSPAATMRNTRPFAPDAAFFSKEALLVVARVGEPTKQASPFRVRNVSAGRRNVTVRYSYAPQDMGAGYSVKHTLMIAVPRTITSASFVENGRKVCRTRR